MKRFLLFTAGLALVLAFQNCAESSGSPPAVGPAESVTGEISGRGSGIIIVAPMLQRFRVRSSLLIFLRASG